MHIAYVMAPGRGDTDLLLYRLAQTFLAQGRKLCGTVQINSDRSAGPCDMDVVVLPDGPKLRISQDLGAASRGCRLNPMALESAVGQVQSRLTARTDLLLINKFGKHEAEGRGFRSVIADAVALEIPVLVGLKDLNLADFQTFVGDDVTRVDPTLTAMCEWFENLDRTALQIA